MLSPSTSQHVHASDFVRPRPFAEFVQQNKDRLNALKRNWPYGSKFSEVLHVIREVQAHHQRLPLHEASDYDHEEGAMHSALDLANEALVLLKGIPVHMDLPLVKREEQKERVFFSIVLCALFSNIADGDVRYRIDGFDAGNNRSTKKPCFPLAQFFAEDHVRVRLWKKSEPDFHLYQSYASRILHEAGKKVLDKIPDHNFSSLYGFVCAFVENRMKDAQSLDPILFDCLLRAKKKISERNHLLNSGYLDDRTAPTLKRDIALILSELFKNEWSIDKGGALRNSMVLFHAGKVYLRYPEAFSYIEQRLDSRWADSHIPINPKKILSNMTGSGMVEQEPNSLMERLKFVEEPELPGQKTKAVTVQADAVALSNPSQYLAEGTKTREYHEQDRVKNNLSRLVKEKIEYGENGLSVLEEETCVAEYDISSNGSSGKQTERSKGFTKLFDAILPALKKDAETKSKINKDSEPKSPAELAVIKAKRNRKEAFVKQKTKEIETQLAADNVYPYADKKGASEQTSAAAEAVVKSKANSVSSPSVEGSSPAVSSSEQNLTVALSSNKVAEDSTEKAPAESTSISFGSRLKGFGRSFSAKLQGAVASIKKVKIFEFSKEPSLSVPAGHNVSAEEDVYYVAPTEAASKGKISSSEDLRAASAEPSALAAHERSFGTETASLSTEPIEQGKPASISTDSSSIANFSEKAVLSQTTPEENCSSGEDSVNSIQEPKQSLCSEASPEPKSLETSTAVSEDCCTVDSLEPSKESLTSLATAEVSPEESSVEAVSKSPSVPASSVEGTTAQALQEASEQPAPDKTKSAKVKPTAELQPSELSPNGMASKDANPKAASSAKVLDEQKENIKAVKTSKDKKPVKGSVSSEKSTNTANNNGAPKTTGFAPNKKQSKEQTAQLETSSAKRKNSNKSSSDKENASKQDKSKQVPTTVATAKNASTNKAAKTNKVENATKSQGQAAPAPTKLASKQKADSAVASEQVSNKPNTSTANSTVKAPGAFAQKKSEPQKTGANESKSSQKPASKKDSAKTASAGTESQGVQNKNQKPAAQQNKNSTAKSLLNSSDGKHSESKTRTDIRNEAVKQHNKEKAAAARKENKRVNDILAVAGKPKAELQGLTPIAGAKKSKGASPAPSSASNAASKQKKSENQLSSSTGKNAPKTSSGKTSASSGREKSSLTAVKQEKKAGDGKITSVDKNLSTQKLPLQESNTQELTTQELSPKKTSPQKASAQKPTTEGKASQNFSSESLSTQKLSSTKKTSASQKGANKAYPSTSGLSPEQELSAKQELSPEEKTSSENHLLSPEAVSVEPVSPSPASCESAETASAGDKATTLENKTVENTKEGAKEKEAPYSQKVSSTPKIVSTQNISPTEGDYSEKQLPSGERLLTSTSLPSENSPSPAKPLPTASADSKNEKKEITKKEAGEKETTTKETAPEETAAEKTALEDTGKATVSEEKGAGKSIVEETTSEEKSSEGNPTPEERYPSPEEKNPSPGVLSTSLGEDTSRDEGYLLPPPLLKEKNTAGEGLPTSSEEASLPSSSRELLSYSLQAPSPAGERKEVRIKQTQEKKKSPSSAAGIASDKNVVCEEFICPQDTELQLPSKPLLLCAPATVSIADQKSAVDSQGTEVESESDKISLEEGLAQLFSMDVKDFFSEDSEADVGLNEAAKASAPSPSLTKAMKEFIPDPNNPLVAKGAQFIYSVSDDETSVEAECPSNRSAKSSGSKAQKGLSPGSNESSTVAGKAHQKGPAASHAPVFGDQCVITRTHMFGSSSAGREYESGILTIRADVAKLTTPETKEPPMQQTGKKTRAQKIKEAQLATIRGQAKKEVKGKAQKPGRKNSKKSEPSAPLPSKISHLGVSLFVSRFGLK